MRWQLRRTRMVERTCLECGETWTLKAKLARGRPPGRRRGFSGPSVIGSQSNPLMMFGAGMDQQMAEARRRDAQADRDLDVLRQMRSCPKCGSDRYTQRSAS